MEVSRNRSFQMLGRDKRAGDGGERTVKCKEGFLQKEGEFCQKGTGRNGDKRLHG